jgi:hypothetical protein
MTSILTPRSSGLWLCLFLITACGSSSPAAPTSDFISLTSILPAAGTTLTAGDRVTFTAVVDCTIVSSNGGFAAMVIQDHRNISLLEAGEMQPQAMLAKGTTTVTLSHTVTIPQSASTVTVALPIFVNDSSSTRAVVVRNYTVR